MVVILGDGLAIRQLTDERISAQDGYEDPVIPITKWVDGNLSQVNVSSGDLARR